MTDLEPRARALANDLTRGDVPNQQDIADILTFARAIQAETRRETLREAIGAPVFTAHSNGTTELATYLSGARAKEAAIRALLTAEPATVGDEAAALARLWVALWKDKNSADFVWMVMERAFEVGLIEENRYSVATATSRERTGSDLSATVPPLHSRAALPPPDNGRRE